MGKKARRAGGRGRMQPFLIAAAGAAAPETMRRMPNRLPPFLPRRRALAAAEPPPAQALEAAQMIVDELGVRHHATCSRASTCAARPARRIPCALPLPVAATQQLLPPPSPQNNDLRARRSRTS